MYHALGGKILDEQIAGGIADDGQVIVVRIFGRVGGAAENKLPVVAAIHVGCEKELALAVFAVDAASALLGADERRQQERGEDSDDGDHDEKLDQGEGARPESG